jgi:hypothetical protein
MSGLSERWTIALLDGAISASGYTSCQKKECNWKFRFAGAQYRAELKTREAIDVNYICIRKSFQHVTCSLAARIKWGTPMMYCDPMSQIGSTTKLAHEDWERNPNLLWVKDYSPGSNID